MNFYSYIFLFLDAKHYEADLFELEKALLFAGLPNGGSLALKDFINDAGE
jgi:hypothetical protein